MTIYDLRFWIYDWFIFAFQVIIKLFQPFRIHARNISFYFLLAIACSFWTCTEEPPPTLNAKDRDLVDSLYRDQVTKQKPIIDSICAATFDSLVQVAVDSIMAERLEEIENQLRRIRQAPK